MPTNNINPTNRTNQPPSNNKRPYKPSKPSLDALKRKMKANDALRKDVHKLQNELKVKARRNYIGRTVKAGADEFVDTKVKAVKGGSAMSTKELARWNRFEGIKRAGKGALKGNALASGLSILQQGLIRLPGQVGDAQRASYQEQERRKENAVHMGMEQLDRLVRKLGLRNN